MFCADENAIDISVFLAMDAACVIVIDHLAVIWLLTSVQVYLFHIL